MDVTLLFIGFPALVLTIKEMQVSLNLSKRLAFAGKFSGFCVRFDEQFHFRHKTWTIDPRKHKSLNYGECRYQDFIMNQSHNIQISKFPWKVGEVGMSPLYNHDSTIISLFYNIRLSCVLSFPSGEVPTGTYRLCIVNQLRDDGNGTSVISLGILIHMCIA